MAAISDGDSHYYQLEEHIPAEHAIGGKAFWAVISDEDGQPFRSTVMRHAECVLHRLLASGRTVRLVCCQREVCLVGPRPKIRMLVPVHQEIPCIRNPLVARQGVSYPADMNRHGAVSAIIDGELLGLKPGEFIWEGEGDE